MNISVFVSALIEKPKNTNITTYNTNIVCLVNASIENISWKYQFDNGPL